MSSFPTPTFARELFQKSPFSDGGFLDQLQEKHGLVEEEEVVIEKEVVVVSLLDYDRSNDEMLTINRIFR
ncbi:hypothetical protein TrLO_g1714 [Triparma laevis f. longispina]|uniref:Uncharacterized protein n=1 Tax=Triparma laevis f. longispina TaxID=1714387 RepID=A0A9W7FRA4_9STRA|nr:hypothetical protein TrLO_g1714 [Triparma laevis f. longispina]